MGSCVFRCEVTGVDDRSLSLVVTVVDGQSIAGMSAAAMPRSPAFGLQWLVESTWTAERVGPLLEAFAAADPDAAALCTAAPRFVERLTLASATGFPIHAPGSEYNELVERHVLAPARFAATLVVTDAEHLRHFAPGQGWDSPCGALFE